MTLVPGRSFIHRCALVEGMNVRLCTELGKLRYSAPIEIDQGGGGGA